MVLGPKIKCWQCIGDPAIGRVSLEQPLTVREPGKFIFRMGRKPALCMESTVQLILWIVI